MRSSSTAMSSSAGSLEWWCSLCRHLCACLSFSFSLYKAVKDKTRKCTCYGFKGTSWLSSRSQDIKLLLPWIVYDLPWLLQPFNDLTQLCTDLSFDITSQSETTTTTTSKKRQQSLVLEARLPSLLFVWCELLCRPLVEIFFLDA